MSFFKLMTSYCSSLDSSKLKTSVACTDYDEPLKAVYKHTFKEAINILFPVVFLNPLILHRAFLPSTYFNHWFRPADCQPLNKLLVLPFFFFKSLLVNFPLTDKPNLIHRLKRMDNLSFTICCKINLVLYPEGNLLVCPHILWKGVQQSV